MAHGTTIIVDFQSLLNQIIEDFVVFVNRLQNLTTKWKLEDEWTMDTMDKCNLKIIDAEIQITANVQNMLTKEVQILVFGCTNAGKSALINAILMKKILPSHEGSTTICFTEVHRSTDNSSYIIFPGDSTRKHLSQINLVDEARNEGQINIPCGSSVKIYISEGECPNLREDVIIIDSPGNEGYADLDKHITERCRISDILILVINSGGNFGQMRKEFLKSFRTQFSKLKIIVVINKWDMIADEDKEYYKDKHKREANECLREATGLNINYDIFFLSATEQLNTTHHGSNYSTINCNEERRRSFNDFLQCLQGKVQSVRQITFATNINILMSTIDELQQCRKDIEMKLHHQIETKLSHFNESLDLNKTIQEHLNYIFNKDGYELYFSNGVQSCKSKLVHESTSSMEIYLKEYMIVIVESLKILIGDSIREANNPDSDFIIQTLETFYYPFLYDIVKEIQTTEMNKLNEMFEKIAKDTKIWIKCVIAAAVVPAVPLAAVAGIVAGVLIPGPIALVPILGVAGAAVGGGAAGQAAKVATNVRKLKRKLSKVFYKAKEKKITEWWLHRKENLEKSYKEFTSKLRDRILIKEFSELKDDESRIEKDLNSFLNECGP